MPEDLQRSDGPAMADWETSSDEKNTENRIGLEMGFRASEYGHERDPLANTSCPLTFIVPNRSTSSTNLCTLTVYSNARLWREPLQSRWSGDGTGNGVDLFAGHAILMRTELGVTKCSLGREERSIIPQNLFPSVKAFVWNEPGASYLYQSNNDGMAWADSEETAATFAEDCVRNRNVIEAPKAPDNYDQKWPAPVMLILGSLRHRRGVHHPLLRRTYWDCGVAK
ncbi:uncharacterized protein EV420DRAFT_1479540 [Desarmillaria tabescens]|uniref:Uncharacterized protein n=1 Tax=Armillaria tabescens TaxID=1929756 RepID=A0AA39KFE4_ARMTA|nr:uncharacterized protein EV420DRAFT_1479540 [Desarmillaria tabescens]KAK0458876.1 hypothetical protein EV420DRAFT_1479540 [Desarmillaria tabescens]